jgi:hypothetical protein
MTRLFVHHIDGDPRNNDPSNLRLVDASESVERAAFATAFRDIGEALFGTSFAYPLALDLDVSPRCVQRWASGRMAIPDGIWAELAELCKARRGLLARVEKKLRRMGE